MLFRSDGALIGRLMLKFPSGATIFRLSMKKISNWKTISIMGAIGISTFDSELGLASFMHGPFGLITSLMPLYDLNLWPESAETSAALFQDRVHSSQEGIIFLRTLPAMKTW